MKHAYEVICGNVGSVYFGSSKKEALKAFLTYRELSDLEFGRASKESVTLFCDNEIIKEYIGAIDKGEENL